MKILLIFVLWFMFVFSTLADQVSYQESGQISNGPEMYVSGDRKIQYNWDFDDKYLFMGYRQIGLCPAYCGVRFDALGLGGGVNHKLGPVNLFAQAGYYWIKNNINGTPYNEVIYYYLNNRFAYGSPVSFKSYEVTNENAFGATLGLDIPVSEHFGFKFSYSYLNMKINIIGNFSDPPKFPNLWWDPINLDLNTFNAGVYLEW